MCLPSRGPPGPDPEPPARQPRRAAPRREPRSVDGMARIILFIVAAVAILVLFWLLFWGLMHVLVIGFWILAVALLGFGLFRIGRWSGSRQYRESRRFRSAHRGELADAAGPAGRTLACRLGDRRAVQHERVGTRRGGRLVRVAACLIKVSDDRRIAANRGAHAARAAADGAKLAPRHRDDFEASRRHPGVGLDVPLVADSHRGAEGERVAPVVPL